MFTLLSHLLEFCYFHEKMRSYKNVFVFDKIWPERVSAYWGPLALFTQLSDSGAPRDDGTGNQLKTGQDS